MSVHERDPLWPVPPAPRDADPRVPLLCGSGISAFSLAWGALIPNVGGVVLGAVGVVLSLVGWVRMLRGARAMKDPPPDLPTSPGAAQTSTTTAPPTATVIDLRPPRSLISRVMMVTGSVVGVTVVVAVAAAIISHNGGLAIGALVAASVILALALIEVLLITGITRRSAFSHARRAPNGVRFVGNGWLVHRGAIPTSWGQVPRRRCVLAISNAGISFRPPTPATSRWLPPATASAIDLGWQSLVSLHGAPAGYGASYLLTMSTAGGNEIAWLSPRADRVFAALAELKAHPSPDVALPSHGQMRRRRRRSRLWAAFFIIVGAGGLVPEILRDTPAGYASAALAALSLLFGLWRLTRISRSKI